MTVMPPPDPELVLDAMELSDVLRRNRIADLLGEWLETGIIVVDDALEWRAMVQAEILLAELRDDLDRGL
jgi:hypothetical protein